MQIGADNTLVIAANGGFAAMASSFVMQSMESIIPWLFVMTAIICCDLFSAWWRCYKTAIRIRFSKAIRDTMAKVVIYYAFVVSACFTDVAAQMDVNISRTACLIVCCIEFSSILGNLMKVHGMEIAFNDIIKFLVRKTANISKEDIEEIIKEK